MMPVVNFIGSLQDGLENLSDLEDLLEEADSDSRETLQTILKSGHVKPSSFDQYDNDPAVCLTECTLAGVMSHSARYGRYGLIFRKNSIYQLGGRPLAYVPENVRKRFRALADEELDFVNYKRFLTILNPPGQGGGQIQDYTHEREWRCPEKLPTDEAVAVVVAKADDYAEFDNFLDGRPFLPLQLLYQMGV